LNDKWEKEISTMVFVKQALRELDVEKKWSYHFPEVAATEEEILSIERKFGYRLDESYRSFLKFANGWKGFYQEATLFGTKELIGSPIFNYANTMIRVIDDDVLKASGVSKEELLPIAATISDKDLFVITGHNSCIPGMVIWFAGEEIERFSNFNEYFLAMLDYNRAEVEDLRRENKMINT